MSSKYVGGLNVPVVEHKESTIAATPRKVFSNAHAYHINSISLNSDSETFISADDLRINLWNLEISDQSFSASLFSPKPSPSPPSSKLTENAVLITDPLLSFFSCLFARQTSSISSRPTWTSSRRSSRPLNFTPFSATPLCTAAARASSNSETCVAPPSAIRPQRRSSRRKTRAHAPFSLRSSPPSLTASSAATAATSSRVIISPSRSGT